MQYTKKEERLVFSSYFNLRLVSYLILCTHFSFGNDKIVNLEQKTDKYLDDYATGVYEDGYFESSLLALGVDVCGFAKRIPARIWLWLTYGDKMPKKLNPKDLASIRISIQSFFAITVYALCSDFGISAEDINQVYFPNVESTFTKNPTTKVVGVCQLSI